MAASKGDTHLGGDDLDQRVIDYIADEFKKGNGIDLRDDHLALQRLKEAAERAKCELSSTLETDINLPFITADSSGPKHLTMKITRAKFEELVRNLVERCRAPCNECIADAKAKLKTDNLQVDEVVLVGGSTRIPMVQELVKGIFGKEPHKGVNPDEVVAVGAAIQGAILAGEFKDKEIVLLDVTPLTLGIETLGGVMTTLVERNTTIPTGKKEIFSTAADNQTTVEIHILQGERPMARDNRTLGRFQLAGIPPAPRGMPQIEVAFDIDANGILNVTAKDLGTGKEQSIVITQSSGLSDEEVQKMKKEGEAHAEEDKKLRTLVDKRNQADALVYSTENTLKEHGDKLGDDDRKRIEDAIKEVKEAIQGDDVTRIDRAVEALNQASHSLARMLYQQAENTQGASAGQPAGAAEGTTEGKTGGDDDVIDAEYEVKE